MSMASRLEILSRWALSICSFHSVSFMLSSPWDSSSKYASLSVAAGTATLYLRITVDTLENIIRMTRWVVKDLTDVEKFVPVRIQHMVI
jgi:hypothetical protein